MSRHDAPRPEGKALDERVQQGLQKKKRCALCTQSFFVAELPGAITYKSILNLRAQWGHDPSPGQKMPSPSQLYKREELCIFCMQFFDVDGLQDAPPKDKTKKGDTSPPAASPAGSPRMKDSSQKAA